ncbi:snake venom metalloproteinase atroxase-like [Pectinophora gossypiella]|uniref:snake venom metalloproteinase atroxase-like n=1 Tax=Pectinophora gossypiella TaxID=13191 RepID=UPI00214E8954|nr:snake venom metalloproteinase atroxase-like [Pectinophora gossypiella]
MKIVSIVFLLVALEYGFCVIIKTRRQHPKESSSVEYFTKPNQNPTIKVLIHIDNVLAKKLAAEFDTRARKKIKIRMNYLVKDVERIINGINLSQKFTIKLIDTKFLKNKSSIVEMDENASNYLRSYCAWQSQKKRNQWFYSVLLTGLDLYYVNGNGQKERRSTGRGYMNGMCSIRNSCTLLEVLEWRPEITSYLLAHEIAHSLGVPHDGPPYNECRARGHMMGARYSATSYPKHWSDCSRRSMKKRLTSKKTWCLRSDVNNYHSVGY